MIFFAEEPTPKTSEPHDGAAEMHEPTPVGESGPAADAEAAPPAAQPALFTSAPPAAAPESREQPPQPVADALETAGAPASADPPEGAEALKAADPPEANAPATPPAPRKPRPPAASGSAGESRAIIKVIGVGGGGGNAVNRMIEAGVTGVDFIAANTDAQVLERSLAPTRIQLGEERTGGLGCGGDPEIGRLAARDDVDRLIETLAGADMVFITVGEGGGTGTGAAPVIACVAQEIRALCVAVATRPMTVEGKRRRSTANDGIRELREYVDTLICVPNDRVVEVYGNLQIREAFRSADDVVRQAVQGISDLIQVPGEINLDFADVRAAMRLRGDAVMGIGIASGERRVEEATEAAISSPLLEDTSIQGAASIVVNVTGGESLTLNEVQRAVEVVREAVNPEGAGLHGSADAEPGENILIGTALDPAMDETGEIKVTVVATGFPDRSRAGATPHDILPFTNRATGTLGATGGAGVARPGSDETGATAGRSGRNVARFGRFVGAAERPEPRHRQATPAAVSDPPENGAATSPRATGSQPVLDEPMSLPEDSGEERWGDLETPAYLHRRR